MAYSQAVVIAGGLAHIPVLTGLFWFFEKAARKEYETRNQALPQKKAEPISNPIIKKEEVVSIEEAIDLEAPSETLRETNLESLESQINNDPLEEIKAVTETNEANNDNNLDTKKPEQE